MIKIKVVIMSKPKQQATSLNKSTAEGSSNMAEQIAIMTSKKALAEKVKVPFKDVNALRKFKKTAGISISNGPLNFFNLPIITGIYLIFK